MLTERGYELSGHSPLKVTSLMANRLRLQSRYYCAMFRRRRYGTRLFLGSFFARRFAPHSWQRRLRQAIEAIDNRHLK